MSWRVMLIIEVMLVEVSPVGQERRIQVEPEEFHHLVR